MKKRLLLIITILFLILGCKHSFLPGVTIERFGGCGHICFLKSLELYREDIFNKSSLQISLENIEGVELVNVREYEILYFYAEQFNHKVIKGQIKELIRTKYPQLMKIN
jgi:hypothetical protein